MKKINRNFKKCFITGLTGSGGSYLCEHILKRDKKIKIYGSYRSKGYLQFIKKKYKNKKRVYFDKLNLQSFSNTKKILNKIKPDLIFHLASNADVRGSFDTPKEIIENNNSITLNLLEAVRKLKIKPIVVICSTSEVYGIVKKSDTPIKEVLKMNPANPYGSSKAFQDIVSQVYQRSFGLNIIITRAFSYTNARRTNLFQTAFAKQIISIERGSKNILTHGNLKSVRCILDVEDVMEAYWLTAKKGLIGEIYNIGGKTPITVGKYLNELIKLSKIKVKCKQDPKLLRPVDVTLQIPDTSKFSKHTGWKPKIPFKVSIKKLLNECRELY